MTPLRTRVAAGTLALALAMLGAACGDEGDDSDGGEDAVTEGPAALTGVVREPAPDVSAVSLPDASAGGEPFTTRAADGSLLLVYFGYTNCPDVCPTTMADVRSAREGLGDDADRVELAMVTIDPARDTDELLTGYVQTFVPDGHALRTEDDAALRAAADAYGANYAVQQGASGDVEVSHTGSLYAVDVAGRMVLQWPFGTAPEDLASDLAILVERSGAEPS